MPAPRGTEAKLWSSFAPSMLVLFCVEARPRKLSRASESPDWESGLAVGVRSAKDCQRCALVGRRLISLKVMTLVVAVEVSPALIATAGSAETLTVVETVARCRRATTDVVAPTSTTTGGRVKRAKRA